MGKQRFVMKCGGSTLAALPDVFFEDLRSLQESGVEPVIVHGGGPAINETLGKLGIESRFVNGLRVTDEATLDVVEMVLAGRINKEIVRKLQQNGAQSLGLSGTDGKLIVAKPVANADEIGHVGDVVGVNAALVEGVIGLGYLPVIAPIGIDESGQRYNINADTAAGAVASSLGVETMIVVTDVPGIMRTVNGEKRVLPVVTFADIEEMIASGEIYGGMIPKVRAAMSCLHGNVKEVRIVDGAAERVLSRALTEGDIGTRIVRA
ncbi:acetylglutamate kinase [Cohnella sp. CIP 111063]|uniref:acetylglutamate kinase n=1 Tax=unclassified Cohnella TaxID=2636738 RepID=UPI000B8BC958|nr:MULTISPECIES: acetylglutamate kinase [unclassified Cohnella]OXS55857.1 acetylglutamate kinase [Cohnella sp. CIP 111063]PRX67057.1 N-acetylglutamate kinase [Cohnella sp. SGD-V74]